MQDYDGLTGTMTSTHELSPQQIQAVYRDNQRKNVALEKILSIVGERSDVGKIAREAMGVK